jgi:hypothetical protein
VKDQRMHPVLRWLFRAGKGLALPWVPVLTGS